MIGLFMKKFSYISDEPKKSTTIFDSMKEVFSLLTACGGLVVYLDNKFSSIDKNFNDKFHFLDKAFRNSRIQSARTKEECKAYVGYVKIYSEQVIRAEAKSDL